MPMNSMPAASRAVLIALRLALVLFGTPELASILIIVRLLIAVAAASCSMLQSNAARADRICSLVIIDTSTICHII